MLLLVVSNTQHAFFDKIPRFSICFASNYSDSTGCLDHMRPIASTQSSEAKQAYLSLAESQLSRILDIFFVRQVLVTLAASDKCGSRSTVPAACT